MICSSDPPGDPLPELPGAGPTAPGWRATHTLAARFADAYLQHSVGTRFEFHGREPDRAAS